MGPLQNCQAPNSAAAAAVLTLVCWHGNVGYG